ncbi:hypothetical protein ACPUYX_00605 [Desulfosporosinus sp. SYSU MS00001]|uniref:hypothetical protein n=1 Tax=Desulfosporosinus sp. SYSU MS00001 TaxID=3416284 RepID=UPI003CE6FD08
MDIPLQIGGSLNLVANLLYGIRRLKVTVINIGTWKVVIDHPVFHKAFMLFNTNKKALIISFRPGLKK